MKPSTKRIAIVATAVIAAGVGWYAVSKHATPSEPIITRNYSAELNAAVEATPDNQRSWSIYRRVLIDLAEDKPSDWNTKRNDYESGLVKPHVAEHIRRHEGSLAEVRSAAELPSLGCTLVAELSREDRRLLARHSGQAARERAEHAPIPPADDNPSLFLVHILAGELLDLQTYLLADALLAARDGDGGRMTDDLVAVGKLADQLHEIPLQLHDMISNTVYLEFLGVWGRLMESHPQLFDKARLGRLDGVAKAYFEGRPRVRFEGDRAMFYDFVQRTFTDDGAGDGLFLRSKVAAVIDDPAWSKPDDRFLDPIRTRRFAGRKEFVDKFERLMKQAEIDVARPLWECRDWPHAAELAKLQAEPRWAMLFLLFTSYEVRHRTTEAVVQCRDAVLAVSAALRFRQERGAWPERLERLVPAYLSAPPVDRFTGNPLRYRIDKAGPLLYSAGIDRDDDGGRAARVKADAAPRGAKDLRPERPWHFNLGLTTTEASDGDLIMWPVISKEELTWRTSVAREDTGSESSDAP